MSKLQEIEHQIATLSVEERARLRDWLNNQDSDEWDAKIAEDAASGRLDTLAEEALAEHQAGKTRPL